MDDIEPFVECANHIVKADSIANVYTVQGNEFDPLFSDNCSIQSIINNYSNTATLAGAIFPEGTTIVTWTLTDESGNWVNCMSYVNVTDYYGIEALK